MTTTRVATLQRPGVRPLRPHRPPQRWRSRRGAPPSPTQGRRRRPAGRRCRPTTCVNTSASRGWSLIPPRLTLILRGRGDQHPYRSGVCRVRCTPSRQVCGDHESNPRPTLSSVRNQRSRLPPLRSAFAKERRVSSIPAKRNGSGGNGKGLVCTMRNRVRSVSRPSTRSSMT